jgi:transcriptional regulator with XRE-family HTH domain
MARASRLTETFSQDPDFARGYDQAQSYVLIGNALRNLREAKGLTQQELARRTGLDQADISKIENGRWGRRGMSIDVLDRILPELGFRISRSIEPIPGTRVTAEEKAAMLTMKELLVGG